MQGMGWRSFRAWASVAGVGMPPGDRAGLCASSQGWAGVGMPGCVRPGAVLRGRAWAWVSMGPHEAVRGGGLASFRGPDRAARARVASHAPPIRVHAPACVPGMGSRCLSPQRPAWATPGDACAGGRGTGPEGVSRPPAHCIRAYARAAGGRLPSFMQVTPGIPQGDVLRANQPRRASDARPGALLSPGWRESIPRVAPARAFRNGRMARINPARRPPRRVSERAR
jgi:hypothetical protein